jgi:hypothetical protein
MSDMRRREFITLLGGAAAAWPLAARAQQLRRVGVLIPSHSQTDREGQTSITAFLDTFQKLGWTDGRNVRIEYRWGAGDAERTKAGANELVTALGRVCHRLRGERLVRVGAPKGTPVEVIDELNKEIQGIIDRNCAWHFVTSPRRCAELDWRHPPRIGVAPWRSSSRRPSSPGGRRRETRFELSRIPNLDSCLSRAPGRIGDSSAQSSKPSSSSRGAPAPAGCGAVGRCRNCGVWRSRGQ